MRNTWRIPVLTVALAGTLVLSAGAATMAQLGGSTQAAATSTLASYPEELTLEKLTTRTKEIEKSVKDLKPAESYTDRRTQYRQLNQTINLLAWDIESAYKNLDADLRAGRITTAVYNAQYDGLNGLEDRLETAWDSLVSKTLDYADGQGTDGTSYQSLLSQTEALGTEADSLVKQAQNGMTTSLAQSWRGTEQKLAGLENAVALAYRNGTIDASEYRTLDSALNQVEDKLDGLNNAYTGNGSTGDWYDSNWYCRNGDHTYCEVGCTGYYDHDGYGHNGYDHDGYDHNGYGHNSGYGSGTNGYYNHSGRHGSGHHG